MRVPFKSEPTYEEIKSLAIKLYLASKRASTTTPTDEELKLGGLLDKGKAYVARKKARAQIFDGENRWAQYMP